MSRDFVGALLQLNAEKQVPRAADRSRRGGDPGRLPPGRRRRGHPRPDRAGTGEIRVYRARLRRRRDRGRADRDDRRRGAQDTTPTPSPARWSRPSSSTATTSAGSAPRPPSRSSSSGSARSSATRSSTSSPAARASSSPARSAGSSRGRSSSTSARTTRRSWPDRAEPARALPHRPARQGVRARGPPLGARSADLGQPDPQGLPAPPVRARGARDPQRDGRDQGDRPRGRQPLEGRRRVAPGRARSRRCDGRPARARGSRPSWPSSPARRST